MVDALDRCFELETDRSFASCALFAVSIVGCMLR